VCSFFLFVALAAIRPSLLADIVASVAGQ
jgi:hypothetical protein